MNSGMNVLYRRPIPLILWPTGEELLKTTPSNKAWFKKTRGAITLINSNYLLSLVAAEYYAGAHTGIYTTEQCTNTLKMHSKHANQCTYTYSKLKHVHMHMQTHTYTLYSYNSDTQTHVHTACTYTWFTTHKHSRWGLSSSTAVEVQKRKMCHFWRPF